ncbi:hypothetical protein DL96DRAFT_1618906 [Flagelloscypha sp. PMI_526]|nr:hypothetical protein DL96DRAFT_1618906 [Flagelloscypha sp. PMI_526]
MSQTVTAAPPQLNSRRRPFSAAYPTMSSLSRTPRRPSSVLLSPAEPSDPYSTSIRAAIAIKGVIPKLKLFIPDALLPSKERDHLRIELGRFKDQLEQFERAPKRSRKDVAWPDASEELVAIRDGLQNLDRRLSAESSRGRQVSWDNLNFQWILSRIERAKTLLPSLMDVADGIENSSDDHELPSKFEQSSQFGLGDYCPFSRDYAVSDGTANFVNNGPYWPPLDAELPSIQNEFKYLNSWVTAPSSYNSQNRPNRRKNMNRWTGGQAFINEDPAIPGQYLWGASTKPSSADWLSQIDGQDESDGSDSPETPLIEEDEGNSADDLVSETVDHQEPSKSCEIQPESIDREDSMGEEEDWFLVEEHESAKSFEARMKVDG